MLRAFGNCLSLRFRHREAVFCGGGFYVASGGGLDGIPTVKTRGDIPGSFDPPAADWFDETSLLRLDANVPEYL